jgi:hypothetical protein
MTEPSGIKTSDLFQVQNTLTIIANLHSKIFDISLDESEKLEIVGNLINDLMLSTGNTPAKLFDLLPEQYLLQLLIELQTTGINIEPFLRGINLVDIEVGLSVSLSLGDFSDEKFLKSLLFICTWLENENCQNTLSKIGIECAKVCNYTAVDEILVEINLPDYRTLILDAVFESHLNNKEYGEAEGMINLTETSSDKASKYSELTESLNKYGLNKKVLDMLPEQNDLLVKFEILIQIILDYHRAKNTMVIDVLIEELIDISKAVDDKYAQTMCINELAQLEMIMGRPEELKSYAEDVLYRVDQLLDSTEGNLAFTYLFSTLIINNYFAQAYEILKKRWGGVDSNGNFSMDGAHVDDIKCAINAILLQIQKLIKENELDNLNTDDSEIKGLYDASQSLLYMLFDDSELDDLLYQIAISSAENGFFNEALTISEKISNKGYKNSASKHIPLLALKKRMYKNAIDLSEKIAVHKIKIETQIIMSPLLTKNGYKIEADNFVQNWITNK